MKTGNFVRTNIGFFCKITTPVSGKHFLQNFITEKNKMLLVGYSGGGGGGAL